MKAELYREHGVITLKVEAENETEGIALDTFLAQEYPGYQFITDPLALRREVTIEHIRT